MVRYVVEDEVVALTALGEVLARVIDDTVSADGADHFHVLGAADAGHVSAKRLGDLDGRCADAPRGAVDQNLLAGLDLALIAKQLKSGGCRDPDGRGLLECEVGGLQDEMVLRGARILGKRTGAPAEHLIAWAELRHAIADRLDRPGDIRAGHRALWLGQPVSRAGDVRPAGHQHPVTDMDRSRLNAYEPLAFLDHWLGEVLDSQDRLGPAVGALDDRLHQAASSGDAELAGFNLVADVTAMFRPPEVSGC